MKNFISKWMIVGLFSLLFMMLSSCKPGIDNMYFSDASESTLDEFYDQYESYLNHTQTYMRENYWTDHMFLTGVDDMPSNFSFLTSKESYTHEEIKIYDPYLNQTMLHRAGMLGLLYLHENQFINNKDLYNACEENNVCDVDGLYFSIDGTKVFKSTEEIDEIISKKNTYFYETTKENKVHLVQTSLFTNTLDSSSNYTHNEYLEDDYEISIAKQSQLYAFYYFDMKTGHRLNYTSDASTGYSYIDYYDHDKDIFYQVAYLNDEITQFQYHQYHHGHIKFSILDLDHFVIGLNHVEGWDTIKHDIDSPQSAKIYQLYLNDTVIDEELLCSFDENKGDLVFHIDARFHSDAELEDIISLHRYGLESGISLDDFDTIVLDIKSLQEYVMLTYPIKENLDLIVDWITSSQEDPYKPVYQK